MFDIEILCYLPTLVSALFIFYIHISSRFLALALKLLFKFQVDHSIITYLMNPQGKYEAHFARSKTNVQMANAIEKEMKNWAPKS
jgi:cytochrome oxidase Cu insertion factor (SCO1/SenC/PrrC family)